MAKLSVKTDDFTLEFDVADFGRVLGKARSNIDNAGLYSFYSVDGCPAVATLEYQDGKTPDAGLLASGEKSKERGEPFFFDNVPYNVWLEMNAGCSNARIRHAAKLAEEELAHRGNVIYGTMNFGNDVGRYDFAFEYRRRLDGGEYVERSFVLTFEVLSQKLDYHRDWRTLVEEIEGRYPMLAYDYLRRTYHTFGKSTTSDETADLIWWNLFDRLQQPFVKACRLIISRPRRKLRGNEEFRRADQLTFLSPRLENELAEHRSNPAHLYRIEREASTHDTTENRFVKFALRSIARKYADLRKELLARDGEKDSKKLSTTAKEAMAKMDRELRQLVKNPFWRGIGPFAGMRQLSLTLQRAPGYSTVFRTFAILNAAYMIHAGVNRMETKDIADLYEIWCFLKVEEFTEAALPPGTRIAPADAIHGDFVKLLSTGLQSTVIFRAENGVELARVVYNPEIKGTAAKNVGNGVEGTLTPTSISRKSSQDPDIVLRLTNSSAGRYQVTYLFDAKYRLEDISGSSVGAPPQDAIDQMHRYRDAIYYAQNEASVDSFAYKKEVVGGYILFPGKGRVEMAPPAPGQQDNRLRYIQSIDKVNIGAIPLRPNDEDNADVLKDFIARLVSINGDLDSLLGHVNPHKGALVPVATARAITEATVYGTYHGRRQLKWIRESRYYNLPADAAKTIGITNDNAKHRKLLALLPPGRNPTEEMLVFKIDEYCGIVTRADLKDAGKPYRYPIDCHHERYLVWKLTDDAPITKRVANVKIISGGQTGVDRGALEAAMALGLDFGGWVPHGWIAEDGTVPAQYRERMQEYPSMGGMARDYRERTKANVRDSHATLILVDSLPLSGGTKLTEDTAAAMMKSHKVIVMSAENAKEDALKWLRQFLGMSSALVLNVAGPRESKAPGVQARAKAFLEELLWEA